MGNLAVPSLLGFLLCGIALGGMVFVAAVVVPLVVRILPQDVAGDLLCRLFPVCCLVLIVVTGSAALLLWRRQESLVLATIAALFAFARWALLPRIERARDLALLGVAAEAKIFGRLRGLSVIIGAAQAAALLAVFLRLAAG
jgi:Domain of unknown function (DUF4149)